VLTPLAGLARDRLTELADMAVIERAPRGSDPLKGREPGRSCSCFRASCCSPSRAAATLVVVGG